MFVRKIKKSLKKCLKVITSWYEMDILSHEQYLDYNNNINIKQYFGATVIAFNFNIHQKFQIVFKACIYTFNTSKRSNLLHLLCWYNIEGELG